MHHLPTAHEDLANLNALADAAAATVDLPSGRALREVHAVPPPRSASAGLETLGMREANAPRAVAQART